MKIVKPSDTERYQSDNGAILWGDTEKASWLASCDLDGLRKGGLKYLIPLRYVNCGLRPFASWSALSWLTAKSLDNIHEVKAEFKYVDPVLIVSGIGVVPVFSVMPTALLTSDLDRYLDADDKTATAIVDRKMCMDHEFMWQMEKSSITTLSRRDAFLAGTGYAYGCEPDDGSSELVPVTLCLDNGDRIVCVAWEWYNK